MAHEEPWNSEFRLVGEQDHKDGDVADDGRGDDEPDAGPQPRPAHDVFARVQSVGLGGA